jgi:pimeloyl-ACP methyl ester carboxylesterase
VWAPPAGAVTRGTVIVLPGRGEHAGVYERLGRRLAADAYLVYGIDVSPDDDLATVRDRVAAVTGDGPVPLVLAGSDTGALHVLALAAEAVVAPDGILLAALPAPGESGAVQPGHWERELAARTTCPVHRARLTDDEAFARGRLALQVPAALAAALADDALARITVPALVLHGDADPVSPVSLASHVAARVPTAELAVVGSAPHDVLNDATHRTVAAHVVQWLERLRNGADLAPIIHVDAPRRLASR